MKKQTINHIKNIITPCLFLSLITGVFTGMVIFIFKLASSKVIRASGEIYQFVRDNPKYYLPFLVGVVLLGVLVAVILKCAKDCRGGGIPTAVASISGLIPLRWVQSIFVVFVSSMFTYIAGVPLGNEGPSVQMGTAVGKGTNGLLAKKNKALERYVMTGGACSGFAIATGSPIAGIVFAIEEAKMRLTPMIFMVASMSVFSGMVVTSLLSSLFEVDVSFFDFVITEALPLRFIWAAIVVGVACGFCAIAFTKLYSLVKKLSSRLSGRVFFFVKISAVFLFTAVFGIISQDFIGSGHSLIDKIVHGEAVWSVLIFALIIRGVLMIFANTEGVTGGLFVPTLAFGAIIAGLISYVLVECGIIPEIYSSVLIAIGMASYLSASSRTPITAILFSLESLGVSNNILPLVIGVLVSYLVIESSGVASFSDTVIEAKAEKAHKGKISVIIDTYITVQESAFAVGKEIRDVLLPPTCTVLSIDKNRSNEDTGLMYLSTGDVLHIHYQTYEPEETFSSLKAIFGEQQEDSRTTKHFGNAKHIVPMA